jgi:hypothetical protein
MEVINHMHTKQIAMSSKNQFKCEECGMVLALNKSFSIMLTSNMLGQHNRDYGSVYIYTAAATDFPLLIF